MTFHLNHVEMIFFIVAILSMVVAVYSLREAMMDQAMRESSTHDPIKTVADANVRQEWFKISISIVMLAASALALFLEPPPPDYQRVPQSLVFAIAWILVGVLLVTASLLDKSMRRRIIRQFHEMRNRRATDPLPQRRDTDQPQSR